MNIERGGVNVAQGNITEIRNHIAANPAQVGDAYGKLKAGNFEEGFPFLYCKRFAGAFHNLFLLQRGAVNYSEDLTTFLSKCNQLNVIGGSHEPASKTGIKPFVLDGRAPIMNTSKFPIQAQDKVYVIWQFPDDQIYGSLFGSQYGPGKQDQDFMYPLVIGGKHLETEQVRQKFMEVHMREVALKCNPLYQHLHYKDGFNIGKYATEDSDNHLRGELKNVHPLYLKPAQIGKFLNEKAMQLGPFEKACYLYLDYVYHSQIYSRIALETAKGTPSKELKEEAKKIDDISNMMKSDKDLTKATEDSQFSMMALSVQSSHKVMRKHTAYIQQLERIQSLFIHPLGIACMEIPSERRGVMDVFTKA